MMRKEAFVEELKVKELHAELFIESYGSYDIYKMPTDWNNVGFASYSETSFSLADMDEFEGWCDVRLTNVIENIEVFSTHSDKAKDLRHQLFQTLNEVENDEELKPKIAIYNAKIIEMCNDVINVILTSLGINRLLEEEITPPI